MNAFGEMIFQILHYVHSVNISGDTVYEHDIKYLKGTNASCMCFLRLHTGKVQKDLEASGGTAAEWRGAGLKII